MDHMTDDGDEYESLELMQGAPDSTSQDISHVGGGTDDVRLCLDGCTANRASRVAVIMIVQCAGNLEQLFEQDFQAILPHWPLAD